MASKQEATRRGVHPGSRSRAGCLVGRRQPSSSAANSGRRARSVQAYIPIGISPACRNIRRYVCSTAVLKMRPITFDFVLRREGRQKRHASEQLRDLNNASAQNGAWAGNA